MCISTDSNMYNNVIREFLNFTIDASSTVDDSIHKPNNAIDG